jgi:two-component system, response regulator PdtaR
VHLEFERVHMSAERRLLMNAENSTRDRAPARVPLRVLIVEDETLISLFLQGVLRDLGHTVSGIAPSLRTALAVAAGAPSDLAIVDVGLAGDGGDGVDTAAALLDRFGIPSLLMTGASFAELGDRIQTAKPLGFLTKPYTEADVESALSGAIDKLASIAPR